MTQRVNGRAEEARKRKNSNNFEFVHGRIIAEYLIEFPEKTSVLKLGVTVGNDTGIHRGSFIIGYAAELRFHGPNYLVSRVRIDCGSFAPCSISSWDSS